MYSVRIIIQGGQTNISRNRGGCRLQLKCKIGSGGARLFSGGGAGEIPPSTPLKTLMYNVCAGVLPAPLGVGAGLHFREDDSAHHSVGHQRGLERGHTPLCHLSLQVGLIVYIQHIYMYMYMYMYCTYIELHVHLLDIPRQPTCTCTYIQMYMYEARYNPLTYM